MVKPYKASTALEALVLNMAPLHHATEHAPDTFKKLKEWDRAAAPGTSMPVYNGSSDKTIYSHERYNYAFRAWHDRIHLDMDLGFGKLAEIKVCNEHIRQARQHMFMLGLDEDDLRALTADISGQVLYYHKYRTFVKDQSMFVADCMDDGIFNTLDSGARY